MGIHLLTLSAATQTDNFETAAALAATAGSHDLGGFAVGAVQTLTFGSAIDLEARFDEGDLIRVTSANGSGSVDARVLSVSNSDDEVAFRVEAVNTAIPDPPGVISIRVIESRTINAQTATALTAAQSGFVQGIYSRRTGASATGKAPNDILAGLTYTTTGGAIVSGNVERGTPLPVGAVVSNRSFAAISILINT